MKRVKFQLYEMGARVGGGKAITGSGGVVYVAQDGDARKQTIYTESGGEFSAATNPRALTNGACEFWVTDATAEIDLYIQAPGGQFAVLQNVKPEQVDDIYIDVSQKTQCAVIPFAMVDTTVTETDTGFDEVTNAIYLPHPFIRVTALDASETIDVGTATADSGDPDGFLAAVSVNSAAVVQGLILTGANTMGALFERQDSANAGDLVPAAHVSTGKSIVWTPSAGSDTGKGFIYLPYILP